MYRNWYFLIFKTFLDSRFFTFANEWKRKGLF